MEKERNEVALTALQKVFGAVAATNVVAFLTALIAKAVLESEKLADKIEAAIDRRLSALPAPTAPAEMTEEEEREVNEQVAEIARTTLAEARPDIVNEAAMLALESVGATKDTISQQIASMLEDPNTIKSLTLAIAKDPESCRVLVAGIINDPDAALDTLQRAIHEASEKIKSSIKDTRIKNIGNAIFAIYNERSDGKSELTDEDITPLVNRVENERVVTGKNARFYIDTIGAWLVDQESKMAEVIATMVYANTAPAVVNSYAKTLVLAGVTTDNTDAVHTCLAKDEDIKLKKQ